MLKGVKDLLGEGVTLRTAFDRVIIDPGSDSELPHGRLLSDSDPQLRVFRAWETSQDNWR